MPSMNWKYESLDATPTIVIVAKPNFAIQWMAENNLSGNWHGYFSARTDDPPNWPVAPGRLTVDVSGVDSQTMEFPGYDEAQTWLNDNVDGQAVFTANWVPPQVG